jgi:ribosomal protein L6P/L9E
MQTPNVDSAKKIMNESNYVVNACNILVDKIVLSSASKTAVLPNICGKQKPYLQKLALIYLVNKWQVQNKNIDKEIQDNMVAIENGLTALVKSLENTDEINAILKVQQSEWAFVKKSFENKKGTAMLGSIFSSINMMIKDFD